MSFTTDDTTYSVIGKIWFHCDDYPLFIFAVLLLLFQGLTVNTKLLVIHLIIRLPIMLTI